MQRRPPQGVLQANQVALAAALQQVGCAVFAPVGSLEVELIALIKSSKGEIQDFLAALGLDHLAVADWKLVTSGMSPCTSKPSLGQTATNPTLDPGTG